MLAITEFVGMGDVIILRPSNGPPMTLRSSKLLPLFAGSWMTLLNTSSTIGEKTIAQPSSVTWNNTA
ncbi:hypothetical protein V6N12_014500 [Hibiscus sabdariffa]|uniref:Uncharacterized protein n=1 Tax=Hibiscus sabdariffa TaxID=183260 RepID=A0ABR2DN92_9ROSI